MGGKIRKEIDLQKLMDETLRVFCRRCPRNCMVFLFKDTTAPDFITEELCIGDWGGVAEWLRVT